MMLLSPFRACLTAGQAQLILADPDHFLDLCAQAIESAHLRSRKCRLMGGFLLLAVSPPQHLGPPAEPAAFGPVGVPPMMTERVTIAPPILFETAHEIPAIVANPFEQTFGGVPGLKEHILGVATQTIAGIAEQFQRELVLRRAAFPPQQHPERDPQRPLRPYQ